MRNDALVQKHPACGGAIRLPVCVAALARCTASRFTPRLPGKPNCTHQIDSILSDSALVRISVIAVGRARKGPERDLFSDFVRRINWPLELVEVEERRPLPAAQKVKREGELLRARVPKGAVMVALDGRGKALSSEEFAARLGHWRDDGVNEITFLIGGADGLDRTVIEAATLTISLGAMTWPHLLVRGMLAEQLYRADQILAGHPYHRAGPPPG